MSILKLKVLGKIVDSGLVAVVRADNSEQAARIAEACVAGGVAAIEITFTVPGAGTVHDVVEGMECGADIVKIFPGETLGPTFVKAVKGPLPQASLMPTGGVALENVADWIKAGCVAVGVGGNLTAGARKGDYQSITDIAKRFIDKIHQARGR